MDKHGKVKQVLATVAMIPGTQKSVVSLLDISDRKRAEEAIRISEERFSKVFNASPCLMLIAKVADNTLIDVNDSFLRVLGYSREEVIGRASLELGIWADQKDFAKIISLLKKQRAVRNFEVSFRTKSSELRVALVSAEIIELCDEHCFLFAVNDITERKLLEEELRDSEAYYRGIINFAIDGFIILDLDANIIEANPKACDMYGYSYEEFIKHNANDMVHPDYNNLFERFKEDMRTKGYFHAESVDVRSDGTPFHVEIKGVLFEYKGEKRILTINRDITKRKQMEKEMARLDKLNLIAEMAAGIGHEIRNPMTTVRGFLQMLGGKDECAKYKDYYALMIEELDRANAIITEFLSLAKNKTIKLSEYSLNSVVRAIYPLIQADAMRMENNIKLDLVDVPNLLLDEKEIRQLILNLVRNGLEAMSPGGNLTIRTFTDGEEVVLAVKDEGVVIEPDALEKIGTPFFTTKDNGTGLGLAVCYSIADRHNAAIKFETSSNETTFFVRFKPPNPLRHEHTKPHL